MAKKRRRRQKGGDGEDTEQTRPSGARPGLMRSNSEVQEELLDREEGTSNDVLGILMRHGDLEMPGEDREQERDEGLDRLVETIDASRTVKHLVKNLAKLDDIDHPEVLAAIGLARGMARDCLDDPPEVSSGKNVKRLLKKGKRRGKQSGHRKFVHKLKKTFQGEDRAEEYRQRKIQQGKDLKDEYMSERKDLMDEIEGTVEDRWGDQLDAIGGYHPKIRFSMSSMLEQTLVERASKNWGKVESVM